MAQFKIQPKDFQYQRELIEWLTALDERSGSEAPIASFIKQDTLHRLDTYQASYLGRITANISETIFEACENLFGKELVSQILASFFKIHPPRAETLTEAASALPNFLRTTDASPEALLFADLAELSLKRWQILISEDPTHTQPAGNAPLSRLCLQAQAAYLSPAGHYDLSEAWNTAQKPISSDVDNLSEAIFASRKGIIFGKTGATEFVVVGVPDPLATFARALMRGASVEMAIDALEQSLSQNSSELQQENATALLQLLLQALSTTRLLEFR